MPSFFSASKTWLMRALLADSAAAAVGALVVTPALIVCAVGRGLDLAMAGHGDGVGIGGAARAG